MNNSTSRRSVIAAVGLVGVAGCTLLTDDNSISLPDEESAESLAYVDYDWQMGRVDQQNSGHIDTESNPDPVDLVWSHSDISVYTEPVFTGEKLFYVNRERELTGVDLQSGVELWSEPDGNWSSPLAVDDQNVYNHAIATDTPFVARDGETGERQWSADIVSVIAPKLYDEAIYVAEDRTGTLVRFEAESGDEAWTHDLETPSSQTSANSTGISVISSEGPLNFVSHSGDSLWRRHLDQEPIGHSHYSGLVLVATGDGILIALDEETGEDQWKYDTESDAILSPPTTVNDRVHILDRDGVVHAVTVDGDSVWTWDTDTDNTSWNGEVFNYEINATNNLLYVLGFDEHIHVLDADTDSAEAVSRWDVGNVTSPPAVVGDVAFLQSGGASIRAFGLGER